MVKILEPIFIFAGIIAFMAIIVLIAHIAAKKRTKKMKAIAMRIGFAFDETKKARPPYSGFAAMNRGHYRKISNLMSGKRFGYRWFIFDYRYTQGSGRNSTTYSQTMFMTQLENTTLPEFELSIEHFLHKLGNILGFKDINFETHPEFSKKFRLKGKDEPGIRKVFTPQILQFFETQNAITKFGVRQIPFIEAHGKYMLFYTLNKRLKPENILMKIEKYTELTKLFDKEKSF